MARLSVIVTSYNIEGYLEDCLDTIVGQSLDDLEIIVVDDGSSDGSPGVITDYAARDPRIVPVLLEENSVGGVATAANAGLDRATGDYVGFADGDDLYDPEMFGKLLQAAVEADADLAMCKYALLDDTDGSTAEAPEKRQWEQLAGRVHRLDRETTRQFLSFIAVPWRKIYRRSMLDDAAIRFPVGDYFYEDNPFHWFTVLTAESLVVVPEVLCYHRVERVGQTRATVDARLLRIFQHHDTIHQWLVDHDVEEQYRTTLLGWAISQMGWISRQTPPDLRRELFDILRGVFAQYDQATVDQAFQERSTGGLSRALVKAVREDNVASFNRILDTGSATTDPLESARYHLKYSGAGKTAKLAGRFAWQRARRVARRAVRAGRNLGKDGAPASSTGPTERDVLFGLAVLEQRLRAIEERLDDDRATDPPA
ncbi:glycosyltransferase family 2 protein [Salsipaludibacter albus]|uniref:glycosyltransferase family 2 protein n=1 Tax=Salsipaludibacter albus TaxID=2849650 RepID=UPI001EE48645|nr:glycosyltransferase [Salsipaludibacter albus]MBY5161216.1 glycosyltransferase [Salsipaludibacter albus]